MGACVYELLNKAVALLNARAYPLPVMIRPSDSLAARKLRQITLEHGSPGAWAKAKGIPRSTLHRLLAGARAGITLAMAQRLDLATDGRVRLGDWAVPDPGARQ